MYTSVQKTPKYNTHFRRKYRDKNHNQQVLNEGVHGKLRERLIRENKMPEWSVEEGITNPVAGNGRHASRVRTG